MNPPLFFSFTFVSNAADGAEGPRSVCPIEARQPIQTASTPLRHPVHASLSDRKEAVRRSPASFGHQKFLSLSPGAFQTTRAQGFSKPTLQTTPDVTHQTETRPTAKPIASSQTAAVFSVHAQPKHATDARFLSAVPERGSGVANGSRVGRGKDSVWYYV